MSHEEVGSIIQLISDKEAKSLLQRIFLKANNVGQSGYTSERFSKEVLEMYNKLYVLQLFKTVEFNRIPQKFIK